MTIFECFSGIGAQHKALTNLYNKCKITKSKVLGISEWYIPAIIAYAKIHYNSLFHYLLKTKVITKQEILEEYKNKVFSNDSKTPCNLSKLKEQTLKELYIANLITNNYGSIVDIKGKEMPCNIDVLTYSFPCQDLSNQGKQKGIDKNHLSSSSLVYQILRILKEMYVNNTLPKVLLMENVLALFSKKFINEWNEIKEILNELGYNTYDTTINAIDKGSIQNRKRVFAVSVLKKYDKNFQFNNKKTPNERTIKDILEYENIEKFYLNNLKKHIEDEFILKPSGIKSLILKNYTTFQSENVLYSIDGKAPTITASGANSRIKIIDKDNNLRYLTPLEVWKLMGFTKQDYLYNETLSKNVLYKLAGNSIVVEVLEDIFKDIYGVFEC